MIAGDHCWHDEIVNASCGVASYVDSDSSLLKCLAQSIVYPGNVICKFLDYKVTLSYTVLYDSMGSHAKVELYHRGYSQEMLINGRGQYIQIPACKLLYKRRKSVPCSYI